MADVHANLPALEAVLQDARRQGAEGIVVAGDLTGGPHPLETIDLLRSLGASMIRGNSDTYLLRFAAGEGPAGWANCRQWALMRWTYRRPGPRHLALIASLPEQLTYAPQGKAAIRVVHGSPRNPSEFIFPERDPTVLEQALASTTEPVPVAGHTHLPWQVERDGRLALNPGAVCGPLNGDVRAQYALLSWKEGRWCAEHRAVPYDLGPVRAAFQESGLLEGGGAMAQAFLASIETGRDVGQDLVDHAWRLVAEAGVAGCEVVPDDIWERAVATFDWGSHAASSGPESGPSGEPGPGGS